MDLIDINGYQLDNSTNTYGVQKHLNQYNDKQSRLREARLRQQLEKDREQQELDRQNALDETLDMSDPLYTNRIDSGDDRGLVDGVFGGYEGLGNQGLRHEDPVLRPGPDLRSSVAFEPVGITRDPRGPIGLRPIIDPITGAKSSGRQIYEKIRLINISSTDRIKWTCQEIPVDPVTNQYTRLVEDENGNSIVCKYTSDLLNAEWFWNANDCLNNVRNSCLSGGCNLLCQVQNENLNSIAEPFFTKDCRIFMKIPKFPNPNNYTIFFNSPFSYIKEISLIAAEIPNPFRTIEAHNNKIIFHIKDYNGRALPFRQDYRGIPFFLIEIVPGIYSLESLLREIENLANAAIDECSSLDTDSLKFKVSYDCVTEIVKIELLNVKSENKNKAGSKNKKEWLFHWRFWSHCTIPEERTLYRMLGFAKPFLRDRDGSDYYSNCYDSGWLLSSSSSSSNSRCNTGLSNSVFPENSRRNTIQRPFARPNLFPETFFYLIIDNLDMGNDAIYACNPDTTINNIFAKIQVIPCSNGYNCSSNSYNNGLNNNSTNGRCFNSCNNSNNDYLYNTQVSSNKVYLESPLRTLDRMDIRFVDAFGDLVDFGRLEHSLTFRIVQYIDYLVDTNFDSTRGI